MVSKESEQPGGGAVRAPGIAPFHRPARVFPPPPPRERIVVAAPPAVPQPPGGGFLHVLFPLVGSLGMIGFALVYRNPLFFAIAGGIAVLMLVASIALRVQQKKSYTRTRARNAERYRAYLQAKKAELDDATARHRVALEHVHPGVDGLWSVVNARSQLWERRRTDPDFLSLRLGRGAVELAAPVDFDLGHDPLLEHEPDLLAEATALVEGARRLQMAPVTAALRDAGSVALVGPAEDVRALARAMVAEVVVAHAPDDARVVASLPPGSVAEWEWLKWLPHARLSVESRGDDPVAVGLAVDAEDFEILLSQIVRPRIEHLERVRNDPGTDRPSFQHVVVLVDECTRSAVTDLELFEETLKRAAEVGVLALVLVTDPARVPSTAGARVEVAEGGWASLTWAGAEGERIAEIRVDAAGTEICEAIARQIAPLRLKIREDQVRRVESESLLDLLHATELDPPASWGPKALEDLLTTPIGIAADGSEAHLDLKESAEGGMGPHGLIVGATGSGKSELLRTLISGLALTHSPEELAFVLVDYKGGATFAEPAKLPHAAGMITNIERDLTLVDRMHEALFGELERRQRLLQSSGGFDRARDYQEHRARHPEADMPPLPSLLVIVDEFGELLTRRPDFLDLFVSIGRTGRSLGVHLLLSTQRLDEGRIRGLEGHLRYRICLRTFSVEESVLALGTREAFDMPPFPGLGYLRVDQTLQHFKAALATRPYREHRGIDAAPARVVRDFDVVKSGDALEVILGDEPRIEQPRRRTTPLRTEMQVVVDRLAAASDRPVRQVWLPPLPAVLTLDSLAESWDKTTSPGEPGWLQAPIGVVDRPREQDQRPYALSFGGRGGHLAVVGAPRSGKSLFLQTLVTSLALAHDPADLQVYGIDLGGGSLHALRDLPHVGEVYGRSDRDGVFRLIRELRSLVAQRAQVFRTTGIAGIEAYHEARRSGAAEDDGYGEVFLLVDNWALLVQEFEDLQYEIADLVAGGLHYGVHVVITSNRWHDIRLNVRDNVGGRVELRLNDPIESEIDRHAAKALPGDVPGRGLNVAGEQVQIALPRVDGRADIAGLGLALEGLTKQASFRWATSPRAPRIKMLPATLTAGDVEHTGPGVPIGVEEFRLEPVVVSPDDVQPHLLVLGDSGCGKTNLLRALLRGIGERHDDSDVRVALVDYRRQLVPDARRLPHVKAIATNGPAATDLVMKLSTELTGRVPAGDAALDAAPWSGPHVYLLVDDYDLVAATGGNPLSPLVDLLAQGRDVGFHVVVARRVGGTVRSSYEPFFQRLVELGTPGLIMSGDPGEGPLLGGVKAQPLPPGRGTLVAQGRASLVQTILVGDGARPLGKEEV